MPAYSYQAVNMDGKPQKGVLEADTARQVRSQLREQGLVPMVVNLIEGGGSEGAAANAQLPWWQRSFSVRAAFGVTDLAVWTRQLAGLVEAGLPLDRALNAMLDDASQSGLTERQHHVVADVRAQVNGGSSLAKALARHPPEFSSMYQAVVAAGEQSGALGTVLDSLAQELEDQQLLKSKVMGAAMYPAIVTLIALLIVVFLVTYVVPQVANVFVNSKRALPLLTQIMLGLSAFMRHWGWALLLAVVGGIVTVRMLLQRPLLRERFDAAFLRLPVIGNLAMTYNTARFAATLALLAKAGVPILRALQTAALTLSNTAMRADAQEALIRVREGAPLAAALASKKRFPTILTIFARLGEQTGQLPSMLSRVAVQLSAQVQRRAMSLATILEPLLIVAMGGMVMLIVLAVLLPIIQMNQWVR